jgi:hypothetical protein
MSASPNIIKCTGCEWESSTMLIWGVYSYELPNLTRVPLDRTFGWCFTCGEMVPVEAIDLKRTARNITVLKKQWYQIEISLKEVEKSMGSFLGLNKRRLAQLNQERDAVKKELDGVQMFYNVFQSRTSPPRCLTCGESNIVRVNIPEPHPNGRIPTGFTHPGCGGELIVEHFGGRFAMRFIKENVYSFDGKKIKEIPIETGGRTRPTI